MNQYKSGNEFLPYHPQASHTPPDFRDGWNACFSEAKIRIDQLQAENQSLRKDAERLDFMQHSECKNLFHIGKTWYSRKDAGQPHKKHESLRGAIDAAIAKEKD